MTSNVLVIEQEGNTIVINQENDLTIVNHGETIVLERIAEGPQGPPGPPGTGIIDDTALHVSMRLAEFNTPEAKAAARANLELQYIDCGEF